MSAWTDHQSAEVPHLLLLLEGMVRTEPRPPDFHAKIAVGVVGGPTSMFWTAELSEVEAKTAFVPDLPMIAGFDAVVTMGPAEAEAIVKTGGASGPGLGLLFAHGDPSVLERFADFYLRRTTILGYRADQAAVPRRSPRRARPRRIRRLARRTRP